MSIAFAQSMRSLQTDRGYRSLISLVIATVLLIAWVLWLFLAHITLYSTGQITEIQRDGTVIAAFPAKAAERLQVGQQALLKPTGELAKTVSAIPAEVLNVIPQTGQDQVRVELYPLREDPALFDANGFTGQVDVEVEQLSPAMLVARVSGQWVDTPAVVLSPQNDK